MEPWRDYAGNILKYVFILGGIVAVLLNLVACYHYFFRTHKWWDFLPHVSFNDFEARLFKWSLASMGIAFAALGLMTYMDV